MQYYALAHTKHHFIVTPDELRLLLQDCHHVVMTTGVSEDYIESDPNAFYGMYDSLYQKLRNGKKLIWDHDYLIADFSTGVTRYLENCLYKPGKERRIPDFLEPCPWIGTFCFLIWKEQLSTAFSVRQFPENICGLCLYYPSKVEYWEDNVKHTRGIARGVDFDDFQTYEMLLAKIRKMTKPLKLEWNDKVRTTKIRVSEKAKKDIGQFHFIASNGIKIL